MKGTPEIAETPAITGTIASTRKLAASRGGFNSRDVSSNMVHSSCTGSRIIRKCVYGSADQDLKDSKLCCFWCDVLQIKNFNKNN